MRAVLIGGSGFLGSHLAGHLIHVGHDVVVYDERSPDCSAAQPGVRYVIGDALGGHPASLIELLRGASVVYHLAWRYLPADSNLYLLEDVEANLIGSLRLLQSCREAGVGRIVFFSSGGSVYGPARDLPITEDHPTNPLSSHAVNKLAVEKYLAIWHRLYGLDYVILRPSNPFGPFQRPDSGQGIIATFLARTAKGQVLKVWGDGSVVRDYIYAGDLARAATLAAETDHSRTVYNIGSGVGRSIRDVLAAIRQVTGLEPHIHWIQGRLTDVPSNVLDASKAERLLGWKPEVCFDDGLNLTWRHFAELV